MEQNRTDLASPESERERPQVLYKQRRVKWNRTERIWSVQRVIQRGPKSFTSRGEWNGTEPNGFVQSRE